MENKPDFDRIWEQFQGALKDEFYAIPLGIEKAKHWKRVQKDEDDYHACFKQWMLLNVERGDDGVRFVTYAYDGNVAATEAGIGKYTSRITKLLRKHFELADDVAVSFKVLRSAEENPAPTAETAPAEDKTSNGESANEGQGKSNGESHGNGESRGANGETLVDMLLGAMPDPWDQVKRELVDNLNALGHRNLGDKLDWYRQGIEPTRLEAVETDGGGPVWKVRSPVAKKTRAVMSLLGPQFNLAVHKVAGAVRIEVIEEASP